MDTRRVIKIENHLTCRICGHVAKSANERNKHIKKEHDITIDQYVLKYLLNDEQPKCNCGCNTNTSFAFLNGEVLVNCYTSNHFPRKKHTAETKRKIKENTEKAIEAKYGVKNIYLIKRLKDSVNAKIKATKFQNHGSETFNNSDKNKETKLNRYGSPTYNNPEKIISTNIEKYGSHSYTASDDGKLKIKNTFLDKYGVENPAQIPDIKQKIKNTNTLKTGYSTNLINPKFRSQYNPKNSKIEKLVCETIKGEHKFIYENKEFDIKLNDDIFEIDGDYYHPNTLVNLTLTQVQNAINDFNKNEIIKQSKYTLYKVHVSDIEKQNEITADVLKDISYIPDHSLTYKQKIITKKYIENYIKVKGVEKLKKYSSILHKFIRTLHPEFPYPEQEENIQDVISSINKYDTSRIFRNGSFDNNSSVIGVNYLKSNSKSYWNTAYKNSPTPVQAWHDDDIMQKVIDYRIGINTSGEVFDFSLHQLIRGLSARRLTVSFFKPILAAAIYDKYLVNKINPVVFDPSAGFGGRLLGFKSKFPQGTYIGVEPSKSTYDELCKLVDDAKFTNVKLYNCKFEDITEIPEYDLAFTSIPYYDLETYDNDVRYNSFDEWCNTFVKKLASLKNLYVNMASDLCNKLDLDANIVDYIQSNSSHFSSSNKKYEVIVKLDSESLPNLTPASTSTSVGV